MSLIIKTKSGKKIGLTDSKNEYIEINNKRVPLNDVYSDEKLRKELNDSIKYEEVDDGYSK